MIRQLNVTTKISFLMTAMFLLLGCGGGGVSGENDQLPGLSGPNVSQTGDVHILFQRRVDTQGSEIFTQTLDEPSTVRIVIRNPNTSFKVVEEYPVPETVEATIRVPVAEEYIVSGFSYREGAARFNNGLILKVGENEGVAVQAGVTTSVSLVLERPTVDVTIPETAMEGSLVQVGFTNPGILRSQFWVYRDFDPVTIDRLGDAEGNVGTGTISFNAPAVDLPRDLSVLFELYIADRLLKDSEPGFSGRFRYYFPDAALAQDPLAITILPEEGEIGIIVTY